MSDDDYYTIRATDPAAGHTSRPSPIRAAVLFATVVIAITVLAVPHISSDRRYAAQRSLDLDPIMTGSIRQSGSALPDLPRDAQDRSRTYVVRRSVLTGGSVCVIGEDGARSGSC